MILNYCQAQSESLQRDKHMPTTFTRRSPGNANRIPNPHPGRIEKGTFQVDPETSENTDSSLLHFLGWGL